MCSNKVISSLDWITRSLGPEAALKNPSKVLLASSDTSLTRGRSGALSVSSDIAVGIELTSELTVAVMFRWVWLLLGVANLRVWLCREMSSSRKPKKDPSQIAKDRITSILEQDVEECGKIARYVRQHSNSRDVMRWND